MSIFATLFRVSCRGDSKNRQVLSTGARADEPRGQRHTLSIKGTTKPLENLKKNFLMFN
jgi:hypothetical protein